jgi:hypothetical protein
MGLLEIPVFQIAAMSLSSISSQVVIMEVCCYEKGIENSHSRCKLQPKCVNCHIVSNTSIAYLDWFTSANSARLEQISRVLDFGQLCTVKSHMRASARLTFTQKAFRDRNTPQQTYILTGLLCFEFQQL